MALRVGRSVRLVSSAADDDGKDQAMRIGTSVGSAGSGPQVLYGVEISDVGGGPREPAVVIRSRAKLSAVPVCAPEVATETGTAARLMARPAPSVGQLGSSARCDGGVSTSSGGPSCVVGRCAVLSMATTMEAAPAAGARAMRVVPSVRISSVDGQVMKPAASGAGVGGSVLMLPLQPGSLAAKRVATSKEGSHRRSELAADASEARLALLWLKTSHFDWYAAMGGQTRIVGSGLDGAILHGLMLQGAPYLYKGRRGVLRYEGWAKARLEMLVGGSAYPPTPALVSWFITDETNSYRAQVETREADGGSGKFKGLTATGLVKQLNYAHLAFGAPFPPELLKHPLVRLAAVPPPDCEEEEEEEAHMSLFLAMVHATLARDGSTVGIDGPHGTEVRRDVCEVARDWARCFCFLEVNGLRGVEGLRSRISRISMELHHLEFKCAGGKPRKMVRLTPFSDYAPDQGFDGHWPWCMPWAFALVGHPFILRAFKVPKGGNFLFDARWDGCHAASPQMLNAAWKGLASAPPYCATPAQLSAGRTTPYAPRHVLQDVVRDQGWVVDDRNELNRWAKLARRNEVRQEEPSGAAPRARGASIARRPVNRYSAGKSAQDRRLDLRIEALHVVQRYLAAASAAGKPWWTVLPMEIGVLPSFSFLRAAAAAEATAPEGAADG
jgi:hypothetical protein